MSGAPGPGPSERATAIFKDLLALPPDVRARGATLRCGDDVALRVEVEALLAVERALSDLPSSDQSGVSPFTMPLPTGSPSREGRAGPLAPGSRLGPYQIEQILGKGGMGVVYRARNDLSEKVVAIKVISPELLDNPEHRQRFLREIRIAIQIDDPRFVKTITAEDYSGTLFLVMEYIQGEDLERLGSRHPLLPPEEAVRLIITAAEALQYLHDTGVVHRDVKPSNLMVTRDGSLKLLDLGIAKLLDLKTGQVALTDPHGLIGTWSYMAPEQVGSSNVDGRADVYSLGATLWFLLTGKTPPPASVCNLASELRVEPGQGTRAIGLPAPSAEAMARIPGSLKRILARMVDLEPGRRLFPASEAARILKDWLDTRVEANPEAAEPLRPHGRFSARLLWSVVIVLLILAVLFMVTRVRIPSRDVSSYPPQASPSPSPSPPVALRAEAWLELLEAMERHLDALDDPEKAAHTRFFLACPLGDRRAEQVVEALKSQLRGSRGGDIPCETIGLSRTGWCLAAFVFSDLAWSVGDWDRIHVGDPYGLSFTNVGDLGRLEAEIQRRTGSLMKTPLRADWYLLKSARGDDPATTDLRRGYQRRARPGCGGPRAGVIGG